MFYRLEISILQVILFVAVGSECALNCPSDKTCNCESNKFGYSRVFCEDNDSAIQIIINSGKSSIRVTCSNSKWSDFNLQNLTNQVTREMSFYTCDLPNNSSLKTITNMLGVTKIKYLTFCSYKNVISFKRLHLKGFKNLLYLDLSNNNIFYVDQDLLADLPKLRWLYLGKNNLRNVTLLFQYVSKLQILSLQNNMLQSIEPGTFDSLKNLTTLSLQKNNLSTFPPRIFDKLDKLKKLNLKLNNLVDLPENIFEKLKNLETLNLAKNNFILLPKYLLRNNTNLRIINLTFNKKQLNTLPNKFFSNLTKLETLELNNNGFTSLPEDLLWGCFALITLVLSKNYLDYHNLPEMIFRDLTNVTQLKIDSNKFEKLPHALSYLDNLRELDASNNHISSITAATFINLTKLEKLNMAQNHLYHILDRFPFSLTLKIANFSNNYLTLNKKSLSFSEEEYSPFALCFFLEELYLANNHISNIFDDWNTHLFNLRKLDLKHNYISRLSTENLQFVSENIKVDLRYNKIQHISLNAEEFLMRDDDPDGPNRAAIFIDNNPLDCGCEIYDYLQYLENKMDPNLTRYLRIIPGNLTCWTPHKLFSVPVTKLQSKSFKCDISVFASVCSKKCECIKKPEQNIFIMDCAHQNFTSMPKITGKLLTFKKIELNFYNNRLTQMPNLTELRLEPVSKLVLSNNNISNTTLDGLSKTIEVLELHNNNISKISSDVLNFLRNARNLIILTLHGNPWTCDCSTTDFLDFIHMKREIITDLQNITCYGKDTLISSMTMTDFCPKKQYGYILFFNILILMFFLVGFIIGISKLFSYFYPHSITYIQLQLIAFNKKLFSHRSLIEEEEELDEEKLYDAFVSYSQDDHDFVMKELVRELRNNSTTLKLCLPYRDWQAGEWTTANILKSVTLSRRIIVILSPSYLESIWGKTEFRIALSQGLCMNQSNVILILHGDIEFTDEYLDPILKTYIDAKMCVKWGDPWFWNKFRQLLEYNSQSKS